MRTQIVMPGSESHGWLSSKQPQSTLCSSMALSRCSCLTSPVPSTRRLRHADVRRPSKRVFALPHYLQSLLQTHQQLIMCLERGRGQTHRPDVIELPVQHAHGVGIRSTLQTPPVGYGHIIGMRLLHLCQVCPEPIKPAPGTWISRLLTRLQKWQGIIDM